MEIIDDFIGLAAGSEQPELLPKSRQVPLGSGKIPSDFGLTDYLYLVYDCRLPKEMKRTLIYFATRFNWKYHRATFVSLTRAANDLGVGRKYIGNDLKNLEKWGWVSTKKNYKTQTFEVTVEIGTEFEDLNWPEEAAKAKQLAEQNLY